MLILTAAAMVHLVWAALWRDGRIDIFKNDTSSQRLTFCGLRCGGMGESISSKLTAAAMVNLVWAALLGMGISMFTASTAASTAMVHCVRAALLGGWSGGVGAGNHPHECW